MITNTALIQKVQNRWQYYLLLGRWKRAERVQRLLDRLTGVRRRTCRQSA